MLGQNEDSSYTRDVGTVVLGFPCHHSQKVPLISFRFMKADPCKGETNSGVLNQWILPRNRLRWPHPPAPYCKRLRKKSELWRYKNLPGKEPVSGTHHKNSCRNCQKGFFHQQKPFVRVRPIQPNITHFRQKTNFYRNSDTFVWLGGMLFVRHLIGMCLWWTMFILVNG